MVGYIVLVETGSNLAIELALTAAGVSIMWLTALVAERGAIRIVLMARHALQTRTIARPAAIISADAPQPTVRTGRR